MPAQCRSRGAHGRPEGHSNYDNRGLKLAQFRFYEIATDVNGDASVDLLDLVTVAASHGSEGSSAADANGDGYVDLFDLVLVGNNLQ